MISHAVRLRSYFKKNHFMIAFSVSWISGILAGLGLSLVCKPFLFLQMRSAILQPVSIVGLCCTIFLPLLCTYLSFLLNRPIFVLAVCFIKAVSHGFSLSWVFALYNTASWLMYTLFMFSDCCFLLLLFFLWLRYPYFQKTEMKRFFRISIISGLLIVFGDYFIISPFLAGLF